MVYHFFNLCKYNINLYNIKEKKIVIKTHFKIFYYTHRVTSVRLPIYYILSIYIVCLL